jgi:hypothetical protein
VHAFSLSFRREPDAEPSRPGNGSDETDKVNGNVANLNELNRKSEVRRKSSDKSAGLEPDPLVELDNVRSMKNLNLKNQLGTGSTNGQVRSSYWTSQALQNDNSQSISEVNQCNHRHYPLS